MHNSCFIGCTHKVFLQSTSAPQILIPRDKLVSSQRTWVYTMGDTAKAWKGHEPGMEQRTFRQQVIMLITASLSVPVRNCAKAFNGH